MEINDSNLAIATELCAAVTSKMTAWAVKNKARIQAAGIDRVDLAATCLSMLAVGMGRMPLDDGASLPGPPPQPVYKEGSPETAEATRRAEELGAQLVAHIREWGAAQGVDPEAPTIGLIGAEIAFSTMLKFAVAPEGWAGVLKSTLDELNGVNEQSSIKH